MASLLTIIHLCTVIHPLGNTSPCSLLSARTQGFTHLLQLCSLAATCLFSPVIRNTSAKMIFLTSLSDWDEIIPVSGQYFIKILCSHWEGPTKSLTLSFLSTWMQASSSALCQVASDSFGSIFPKKRRSNRKKRFILKTDICSRSASKPTPPAFFFPHAKISPVTSRSTCQTSPSRGIRKHQQAVPFAGFARRVSLCFHAL